MEKMFKRSLVGAAIAAASVVAAPAMANDNVEIYGQAAISYWVIDSKAEGAKTSTDVDNESRIGFRGSKQFKNFGPKFIWQMESGNVGDEGKDGRFGARDTFGGFEWDNGARFRFGRVLTPAYEIIDWPYTNPGLGPVFDWNTDIMAGAHHDRHGDQFRFDSANYNGFSYDLAFGAHDTNTTDEFFYGAAAHYTKGIFTGHLGFQLDNGIKNDKYDAAGTTQETLWKTADRQTIVAGVEFHFENGFSVVGAWKGMQSKYEVAPGVVVSDNKESQNSYSVTAQYVTGDWLYKLGYAYTDKLKSGGSKVAETDDQAITARIMYFVDPSAVIYSDIRSYDMNGNTKDKDATRWGIGVEYYF
ncbi:porin [Thaumasiovibrio subtropicus]|uniref:porin n=1 Tax=Thaumasiovibrio subtropicus TaxID=1891207 RepID=UPI000B35DFEF|nr:porin [Thaumasiovibrio subtropicus]